MKETFYFKNDRLKMAETVLFDCKERLIFKESSNSRIQFIPHIHPHGNLIRCQAIIKVRTRSRPHPGSLDFNMLVCLVLLLLLLLLGVGMLVSFSYGVNFQTNPWYLNFLFCGGGSFTSLFSRDGNLILQK